MNPQEEILVEAERQRLSELRAASSDAACHAIIFVGIAFIILAVIKPPAADARTAELLCGAMLGAFLWNLRRLSGHYLDMTIALSVLLLPPASRRHALAWLINIKSALILLYHSMPFLIAATATDVSVVGLQSAHPLHIRTLHNLNYFGIYVACFTAALTFPAVTVAIGIWKQSSTEARLIAQAASLRDYYFSLAERLEGVTKVETPGTIALKGIGETFNDAVYSLQVDQPRLVQWFQALLASDEKKEVRPSALIAIRSIMGPFVQGAAWRVAVSSAMNYAIYAALTSIGLAILSWRAENIYGICAAFFALVIALRATTRFLAGEQIPLQTAQSTMERR